MSKQMTQEKLAELSELNTRTVQKIEAGKLDIVFTTLIRLYRSLEPEWGDFLKDVHRQK